MKKKLNILFEDEHYVAVHKPNNLLVHRTALSREKDVLLQRLRNKVQQHVYPVHRLDRATSGVIIFGKSSEAAAKLSEGFREREVEKIYLAIVRGYTEPSGRIDRPMRESKEMEHQEALTFYRTLATRELPVPVGPYQTARYSLVQVKLETGRRHQIRKHFKHIAHPLVGDTVYGDGDHNVLFREEFQVQRLMLLSARMSFQHPYDQQTYKIQTEPDEEIMKICERFQWCEALQAVADSGYAFEPINSIP